MKYYLIAGEPSGDLHGANLIGGFGTLTRQPNSVFGAATAWPRRAGA